MPSVWTKSVDNSIFFSFCSSVKLLSQNIPNVLFTSALGLFWEELSWIWVLGCDSYPGHILGSCFVTGLNGLWLFQGTPGAEEEAGGCQLLRAGQRQRQRWQTPCSGRSSPQREVHVLHTKDNGEREPSSDFINYLFRRLVCLIVSNIWVICEY